MWPFKPRTEQWVPLGSEDDHNHPLFGRIVGRFPAAVYPPGTLSDSAYVKAELRTYERGWTIYTWRGNAPELWARYADITLVGRIAWKTNTCLLEVIELGNEPWMVCFALEGCDAPTVLAASIGAGDPEWMETERVLASNPFSLRETDDHPRLGRLIAWHEATLCPTLASLVTPSYRIPCKIRLFEKGLWLDYGKETSAPILYTDVRFTRYHLKPSIVTIHVRNAPNVEARGTHITLEAVWVDAATVLAAASGTSTPTECDTAQHLAPDW